MTNLTEQGAAEAARPGFEAWASSQNWVIDRDSFGDYVYGSVRDGWEAYRAGLQASTPEGCWTDVAQGLPEPQKPVLLDIGLKYPIRAMWVEAKTLPVGADADDDFGDYDEETDEWYCRAGWYEWNQHEEVHWLVTEKPLRWVPLPATPGDPHVQ